MNNMFWGTVWHRKGKPRKNQDKGSDHGLKAKGLVPWQEQGNTMLKVWRTWHQARQHAAKGLPFTRATADLPATAYVAAPTFSAKHHCTRGLCLHMLFAHVSHAAPRARTRPFECAQAAQTKGTRTRTDTCVLPSTEHARGRRRTWNSKCLYSRTRHRKGLLLFLERVNITLINTPFFKFNLFIIICFSFVNKCKTWTRLCPQHY